MYIICFQEGKSVMERWICNWDSEHDCWECVTFIDKNNFMLDFVTVANSVMDMEDIHKKQQQQNNKH
jgi:hypothetical protein